MTTSNKIDVRRILALALVMMIGLSIPLTGLAVDVTDYEGLLAAASGTDAVINIRGNITYGPDAQQIKFMRDVQIIGAKDDAGNGYTIKGNDIVRLIAVGDKQNRHSITISNLTLTNGFANDYGSSFKLGGALVAYGSAVIENSKFVENKAVGSGGAIYVNGDLQIVDSTFDQNTGQSGGAVHVYGEDLSIVTVSGSAFSNNKGNSGGAVTVTKADITIENSNFTDNTSTLGFGGAVLAYGNAEVNNSTFERNEAKSSSGGALAVQYDVKVTASEFTDNKANEYGGAIGTYGSMSISDSTFDGNNAGEEGAALYIDGFETETNASFIENSDFYNNTASIGNGGSIRSNEDVTISGTSYFNNNTPESNEGNGIEMVDGAKLTIVKGAIEEGVRPAPASAPAAKEYGTYEVVSNSRPGIIFNCREWVNLRGDPSTNNPPEGRILLGTRIIVVNHVYKTDFFKIIHNDTVYFVHSKFIKLL